VCQQRWTEWEQAQQPQQARGNAQLTTPTLGRYRGLHCGETWARHDPLRTRLPLARPTHAGGIHPSQGRVQTLGYGIKAVRAAPRYALLRAATAAAPPAPCAQRLFSGSTQLAERTPGASGGGAGGEKGFWKSYPRPDTEKQRGGGGERQVEATQNLL
jgi:hypothetical protein